MEPLDQCDFIYSASWNRWLAPNHFLGCRQCQTPQNNFIFIYFLTQLINRNKLLAANLASAEKRKMSKNHWTDEESNHRTDGESNPRTNGECNPRTDGESNHRIDGESAESRLSAVPKCMVCAYDRAPENQTPERATSPFNWPIFLWRCPNCHLSTMKPDPTQSSLRTHVLHAWKSLQSMRTRILWSATSVLLSPWRSLRGASAPRDCWNRFVLKGGGSAVHPRGYTRRASRSTAGALCRMMVCQARPREGGGPRSVEVVWVDEWRWWACLPCLPSSLCHCRLLWSFHQ